MDRRYSSDHQGTSNATASDSRSQISALLSDHGCNSADLSSFRAQGAEDLQVPVQCRIEIYNQTIWLSPVYPGPWAYAPKRKMDKPALGGEHIASVFTVESMAKCVVAMNLLSSCSTILMEQNLIKAFDVTPKVRLRFSLYSDPAV
ncbi:hypothetical protein TNCV_1809471 [Trichonephila clavipes]|nr:hypothetical protein TNCV_1809471 [Trichonephila clavipes]